MATSRAAGWGCRRGFAPRPTPRRTDPKYPGRSHPRPNQHLSLRKAQLAAASPAAHARRRVAQLEVPARRVSARAPLLSEHQNSACLPPGFRRLSAQKPDRTRRRGNSQPFRQAFFESRRRKGAACQIRNCSSCTLFSSIGQARDRQAKAARRSARAHAGAARHEVLARGRASAKHLTPPKRPKLRLTFLTLLFNNYLPRLPQPALKCACSEVVGW